MNKLASIQTAFTFDDLLMVPKKSDIKSRSSNELDTSWTLSENRYGEKIEYKFSNPVIPANMDTISGKKMCFEMCCLGKLWGLGILHRRMPVNEVAQYLDDCYSVNMPVHRCISVGAVANDKERIDYLLGIKDITKAPMSLCIDIAHGHSIHMKETLEYIRKNKFRGPIIAGNVCTSVAVDSLYNWGASCVKVGIGPGGVCTTRIKTGCGYPQASAITNCVGGPPIIADGGIRSPGDAAKAIALGASAVMVGSMLAGTDCVPGWDAAIEQHERDLHDWKRRNPTFFPEALARAQELPNIVYRGMASKEAKAAVGEPTVNAEGVSRTVKCKPQGSTEAVIMEIVEGIKSAMSYNGAHTLKELQENSEFIRVTSTEENHPHFNGD